MVGQQKLWATYSLERLDRTLRQLDRLQKAHRKESKEFDRLVKANGGQPPQPLPTSWTRLHIKYEDALYFFIIAARQALSVVPVMRQVDPGFPAIRQADLIKHWRDIEEHWDDPPLGKRLRAMEKWRTVSDESHPSLSTASRGYRLTIVSRVRIKKLKRDLERARVATAAFEDRLWLHLYITPEEAAGILQIPVEGVPRQGLLWFPEMEEEGGGVRYFREQVESLRDTGSRMPDSWTKHFT